ncbi:MAG: MurR/RpiR family transcriptional regulator [Geminicoccaceae bacterium]|nr:MurR/RpiR family transcriptional regulator [Geminicoccaceae bacterium]
MVEVIDVLMNLERMNGSFNKREQRVADFVRANLDKATLMRQSDIASAADVSVATVNRFCQTIGCSGFREFQIWLARSVAVGMQYLREPAESRIEPAALVDHVFSTIVDGLNLARSQITKEMIDSACQLIVAARRVVIFGTGGGSTMVAREAANRFFRLGIIADAYTDEYAQRMVASTLHTSDIVFVISNSGAVRSILDSLAVARQYGARAIVMSRSDSLAAGQADALISVNIPENPDIYKPTASRIVQIAVLDVLATAVAKARPEFTKETLRRVRTALVSLGDDSQPRPIGD